MNKKPEKKKVGFLSKYEDIKLQDIKSFEIKKYTIKNFIEYKLIFLIYFDEIGILIHELSKKDNKSIPLIISKFQKNIKIDIFINKFKFDKKAKTKTFDEIFKIISELIHINKIDFKKDSKNKSIDLIINNKEGKEILNINIPIKINEDKINNNSSLFKLNPSLRNSEIITDLCEAYWSLNKNFVVFNSYHDNEVYLIYQNYDNNNIEILKLINKYIVKYINNIESKLSYIEHFFDEKNKFDYLLTADRNKNIKIYNISLNYELILSFNNGESIGFISSCLLLFNENILITSIFGRKKNDYTKIYSMNDIFKDNKNNKLDKTKDNITLLKKLSGTNNIVICSLLYWDNDKNNTKYIIQLSNNKVQINDIKNYNLYGYLETDESNKSNLFYSGFIYKNTYLIVMSNEGSFYKWNLISKSLMKKMYINNHLLFDCLLWSNNFTIISARNQENKKSLIKIMDITQFKVINNTYVSEIEGIISIKKIIHPKKGDCLLVSGENNKIVLFSL